MQNNEIHKMSEGILFIVLQHEREIHLIKDLDSTKPQKCNSITSDPITDECLIHWAIT